MGTRSTSGHHGQAGALGIVADSDVARSDVGNHGGDKEWRDAACSLLIILECLTNEGADSSDTRAYIHSQSARINILTAHQSAIFHRLIGSSNGILAIEVHFTYIGALQSVSCRVKVLHLRHDAYGEVHVIKPLDKVQSAFAFDKAIPEIGNSVSNGANSAQSCNYNSSFHLK